MEEKTKCVNEETNKTWLDLSDEELQKINVSTACMYGRKGGGGGTGGE